MYSKINITHQLFTMLLFCSMGYVKAQVDSTFIEEPIIHLDKIIVFGKPELQHIDHAKPLCTLDEFLDQSLSVNMIKRGAYAWDPNLNGMSSERLSVTIDGMQIFGACTDKMDPITSYVDVSNLSSAHISHGQSGNEYGNTIGGGIDLKLNKRHFANKGWSSLVEAGFETNNQQKIASATVNKEEETYYLGADITYRDAENYTDGKGNEVLYSQFSKINTSLKAGYKFKNNKSIHTLFIYDKATDVGYPALTMDVSLAKAFIGSLSYFQQKLGKLSHWESKIYINDITHVMDDTTRPDVPIHMDMPGWSKTFGAYSKVDLKTKNHKFHFNVNAYLNKSLAEMTMYPNDPNENLMFMYTWPDVQTLNSGIFISDEFTFRNWDLAFNTRLAIHHNSIKNEFGINSLEIFYSKFKPKKSRFLKSFGFNIHRRFGKFHLHSNIGYGERAPSVSEGYGFYLFNSFDNYDYVGDPNLPNEKSINWNAKVHYNTQTFSIGTEAKLFRINDYIIGKVRSDFAPMTIGADGIKVYTNLDYANIYNFSVFSDYDFNTWLNTSIQASYQYGKDYSDENLPLISPFSYSAALNYNRNFWFAQLRTSGNAKQTDFAPQYGEDETESYNIWDIALGKTFYFGKQKLFIKTGVQNLLNENYSTFSDWRNIPRMGRNIFLHATFTFN